MAIKKFNIIIFQNVNNNNIIPSYLDLGINNKVTGHLYNNVIYHLFSFFLSTLNEKEEKGKKRKDNTKRRPFVIYKFLELFWFWSIVKESGSLSIYSSDFIMYNFLLKEKSSNQSLEKSSNQSPPYESPRMAYQSQSWHSSVITSYPIWLHIPSEIIKIYCTKIKNNYDVL